jgi:hypothetical protein
LGFVLRYAGLLDDAARECDTALKLDRENYQIRSCSWVFIQRGDPQRAMDFIRLDAGSEWAAKQTAFVLMGEFHAINQLLDKGAELNNLVLTPTSLRWSENGPEGIPSRLLKNYSLCLEVEGPRLAGAGGATSKC